MILLYTSVCDIRGATTSFRKAIQPASTTFCKAITFSKVIQAQYHFIPVSDVVFQGPILVDRGLGSIIVLQGNERFPSVVDHWESFGQLAYGLNLHWQ